jgi:hypothetical protein
VTRGLGAGHELAADFSRDLLDSEMAEERHPALHASCEHHDARHDEDGQEEGDGHALAER